MAEWNDKGIVRVRLRRKVSLAVMVVDDLTGLPITSSDLQVSCAETLAAPVRKPDGYHLFMDCPAPEMTITAKGWAYHPRTITVKQADLSPLSPAVKLRLTPNRNYAIPQNTTCLQGTAPPHAQIAVYCHNNPKPLRLLYDYKAKAQEIQLYDPTGQNQEGRQFALVTKGQKAPAIITLASALEEEGSYRLEVPFAHSATKAGTSLYPICAVTADEHGNFFLPLPPLAVQVYGCNISWQVGEKTHMLEQEFPGGKVTALHLEG